MIGKKKIKKNEVVFEKIQVRINKSPFPFLSFPQGRKRKLKQQRLINFIHRSSNFIVQKNHEDQRFVSIGHGCYSEGETQLRNMGMLLQRRGMAQLAEQGK